MFKLLWSMVLVRRFPSKWSEWSNEVNYFSFFFFVCVCRQGKIYEIFKKLLKCFLNFYTAISYLNSNLSYPIKSCNYFCRVCIPFNFFTKFQNRNTVEDSDIKHEGRITVIIGGLCGYKNKSESFNVCKKVLIFKIDKKLKVWVFYNFFFVIKNKISLIIPNRPSVVYQIFRPWRLT